MWWLVLIVAVVPVLACGLALAEMLVLAAARMLVRGLVRVEMLVLAAGLVLVWPGVALAAVGHSFLSSLSEAPLGTRLVEPGSVAVDHSTGQVFVGDLLAGHVDVYSSSGAYVTQFGEEIEAAGIAIDEENGDVYVAEPYEEVVLVYRPGGSGGYQLLSEWSGAATPGKAFGEVTGVAFDNSESPSDPAAGDLYVLESEAVSEGAGTGVGAIDLFKPRPNPQGSEEGEGQEGEYVRRLSGPKLEEPDAIAVDSVTGRVLVGDSEKGAIYAYGDEGSFQEKLTGKGQPFGSFEGKEEEEENVAGLAVEESTGDIYVAEAEHHAVSQYGEAGEWLGWSTTAASGAALSHPRGVALSSAEDVYVADSGAGLVDLFGVGVTVPDAVTGKVSKTTRTTTVLAGTIDGAGKAASYSFQWGESEALGQTTPTQGAGTGEEKVSTTLTGLHAGRTYYYRVLAENENGVNYGIIREFQTPAAVELQSGPVEALTPESATLTGSIVPAGFDTKYFFQWGASTSYGSVTPTVDAGSGTGVVPAEAALAGLSPNSTYHYRLVGENEFGTTYGADVKFTTSGAPRITPEPTNGIGHEQATLHAEVDPDELATTYRFQYGETTAYGSEVPVGGQGIGEGEAPVAVSAALTSLKIGTVYHFRVVAENSAGVTSGPDETFETIPPAPVNATYATGVGATGATLHTEIDPLGRATTYYFQYGTRSCRESSGSCADAPSPPVEVGSGEGDVAESQPLQGLSPSTTYHYRVIDANSLGVTEGPERTFTTEAGETPFALADDRAWEMVTPENKHGAPVEALTREGGVILAAEDGDELTYVTNGSIVEEPQGNRSPEQQQVLARRTPEGWRSEDIATPQSRAQGASPGSAPEYQFFTPDLSQALVQPWATSTYAEPPLSPEATQATMYIRDDASGAYTTLVSEANTAPGSEFGHKLHFVSATPDLAHVLLRSEVGLTGAGSGKGLYEWSEGRLQFVSVLPSGAPAAEAELGFHGNVLAHAISQDGSRVIFTSKEENSGDGHLYMRDTVSGQTIQLDAAQGIAEPAGKGSAQFQDASADGSEVFFTDRQRLTADSTAEPSLFTPKPDLYECEITESEAGQLACHLKDLTVEHQEGEHADVQGFLLGVSEDGSSVYLVAQGVLAGNENGNQEHAEADKDNLYELRYAAGQWSTTFIATLVGEDSPEWEGAQHANTAYLTARVSPNGRYLAFMSAASPTGYDNVDANPEASGARDEEVYLYDADTAALTCVSCNPTGERPSGVLDTEHAGEGLGLLVDRRLVWVGHRLAGNIPGWTAQTIESASYQSRYLSDEGRLFFNSPDDLVPQATNHREDVYEYEPSGVGSCQTATGGCVSLLSSGSSPRESAFLEATPSGDDVFFITDAQLLAQDSDTAFDIYDARVCTEVSPCLTPPIPAQPGCESNPACRPAQAAQQAPLGVSGSASVSGPGNVSPAPKQESKATKSTTKPKAPTRAQDLVKALERCRKIHPHSKRRRKTCETQARRRYGAKQAKGKKSTTHRSKGRG